MATIHHQPDDHSNEVAGVGLFHHPDELTFPDQWMKDFNICRFSADHQSQSSLLKTKELLKPVATIKRHGAAWGYTNVARMVGRISPREPAGIETARAITPTSNRRENSTLPQTDGMEFIPNWRFMTEFPRELAEQLPVFAWLKIYYSNQRLRIVPDKVVLSVWEVLSRQVSCSLHDMLRSTKSVPKQIRLMISINDQFSTV